MKNIQKTHLIRRVWDSAVLNRVKAINEEVGNVGATQESTHYNL